MSFLSDMVGDSPTTGLESADTSVVVNETEFTYFVELEAAVVAAILQQPGMVIEEVDLGYDEPTRTKRRLRATYTTLNDAVGKEFEITTKSKTADYKSTETTDSLQQANYIGLRGLGIKYSRRIRVSMPLVINGKQIVNHDNTPINWELDLYKTRSGDVSTWAKFDLEFKVAAGGDIPLNAEYFIPYIPVTVLSVFENAAADDSQRALVKSLYESEWNLK